MSMEPILTSSLWRLIAWLPGIFLQWVFSADTLAKLTTIDIKSRNDAASVFAGEMPYANVWIEIRNRSPFTIQLDRLTAQVIINSSVCMIIYLDRTTIGPSSDMNIQLRGDMTAPQAYQLMGHMKRQKLDGNPVHIKGALSVHADFNCRIANFSIRNRYLDGITYQITNPHVAPITDIDNRLRALETKPDPKNSENIAPEVRSGQSPIS